MGSNQMPSIPQASSPFCWAECLGGCSADHSREHILTKSTLSEPQVLIEGFPFQAGKPIVLHKNNFSTNILCRYHNNNLSSVDQAGTWTFEALTNAASGSPRKKNVIRGHMFERWLLKTLINIELLANFNTKIPPELVRRVFGKEAFPPNSGMYFIGQDRNGVAAEQRITFLRLHDPTQGNGMVASIFTVGDFKLFLTLGPISHPQNPFRVRNKDGTSEEYKLFYHPPGFKFDAGNLVNIDWKKGVNTAVKSKRKKQY